MGIINILVKTLSSQKRHKISDMYHFGITCFIILKQNLGNLRTV